MAKIEIENGYTALGFRLGMVLTIFIKTNQLTGQGQVVGQGQLAQSVETLYFYQSTVVHGVFGDGGFGDGVFGDGVFGDGVFGDKGGGFGGIFYILIGITKVGILQQKLIYD